MYKNYNKNIIFISRNLKFKSKVFKTNIFVLYIKLSFKKYNFLIILLKNNFTKIPHIPIFFVSFSSLSKQT